MICRLLQILFSVFFHIAEVQTCWEWTSYYLYLPICTAYVDHFIASVCPLHLLFIEGFEYHQQNIILLSPLFRNLYQIYVLGIGGALTLAGYATSYLSFIWCFINGNTVKYIKFIDLVYILTIVSTGVFHALLAWSILCWQGPPNDGMVHTLLAWSILCLHGPYHAGMVHAILAWSILCWHGPCYSGMVHTKLAWYMVFWHGPYYAGMVHAMLAWSMQCWHGPCYMLAWSILCWDGPCYALIQIQMIYLENKFT